MMRSSLRTIMALSVAFTFATINMLDSVNGRRMRGAERPPPSGWGMRRRVNASTRASSSSREGPTASTIPTGVRRMPVAARGEETDAVNTGVRMPVAARGEETGAVNTGVRMLVAARGEETDAVNTGVRMHVDARGEETGAVNTGVRMHVNARGEETGAVNTGVRMHVNARGEETQTGAVNTGVRMLVDSREGPSSHARPAASTMQTGGLGMLEEAETGAVETGTTRPRRSAGASSVLRRISSPVSSPRQQETTETGEAEPRMAFAAPSLPSGIMPDGASHGRRISPVPPTTRRATQGRRMHVDARAYPSARQEPGTCVGRVKNLFRRMWTSSAPASASSQACGPALSGPQAAAAAADAQRSAPPRGQPRDGQRMNPPAAAQDQRHGSSSSDVDQNGYSQDFVRMQLEAWSGCSAGAGGCPWLF